VTHGDASVGFILPSYTHAHITACPQSNLEISATTGSVTSVTGLNNPVASGGDMIVKPSDTSLHQAYSFYTKVTYNGGSNAFFGPYQVKVGCFFDSVTFSDSSSFVTAVSKNVGDATASAYTMQNPTPSLAYCVVTNNVIV
jgi:hypothetical protein